MRITLGGLLRASKAIMKLSTSLKSSLVKTSRLLCRSQGVGLHVTGIHCLEPSCCVEDLCYDRRRRSRAPRSWNPLFQEYSVGGSEAELSTKCSEFPKMYAHVRLCQSVDTKATAVGASLIRKILVTYS